MALIICPECGKEISNTAISCPNCGYLIKEHFEKEKRKEEAEKKRAKLQKKKDNEWEKLQEELNEKLEAIDSSKPSPKPEEPSLLKHIFYYNDSLSMVSLALIASVVLFLLSYTAEFFIVLLALVIVLGIPFAAFITYTDWEIVQDCYKHELEEWREEQRDRKEYIKRKKAKVIEAYKMIASNKALYGTRTEPSFASPKEEHIPKCPLCGSTNIKKISMSKKLVSTEMLGLASGSVGKQFECKNCGYKF